MASIMLMDDNDDENRMMTMLTMTENDNKEGKGYNVMMLNDDLKLDFTSQQCD